MADDAKDSVRSGMAERFKDEKDSKEENTSNQSKSSKSEKTSANSKNASSSKDEEGSSGSKSSANSKTSNIRDSWPNHSFYLPTSLSDDLGYQYKRLDLELDDQYGMSIKKTRHYYPLIVKLGLEQLEELETKEVKERLENFD